MRFCWIALFLWASLAWPCTKAQHEKFAAAILAKNSVGIQHLSASTDCLRSSRQENLLYLAGERTDLATFELLVRNGADLHLRNISDGLCRYEILHVIQNLRPAAEAFPFVRVLVDAGADLQSCGLDSFGQCGGVVCNTDRFPLGQAAARGDVATVNYLAERGARISGEELFFSPPNDAVITARLLGLGADPTIGQNTPIFRTRSPDVLRLLVHKGANINFRQYGGKIPLYAYSEDENFDFKPVVTAIDLGADLRLPMTTGKGWICSDTPALLCWAGQLSPSSLIALYHALKVSSLVDLEQRDSEGRTVIMLLSRYYMHGEGRVAKTEALKLLIARGANLKARDRAGKSVMQYWKEYPRENRVEIPLLEEAGAE